jgi:hypothetical protein
VLVAISKETAAPFVIVFGLAAIIMSGAPVRVVRTSTALLVLGTGAGVAADAAFNMFRYHTLLNHVYLSESRSGHATAVLNFVGLLVSPSGGLAWFWPGAAVALLVLIAAVARLTPNGLSGEARSRVQLGALLGGAFAAYTAGCALWWDPFGWDAWGPRLILPAVPPVVVLAIFVIAQQRHVQRWLSWPALTVAGLVSLAVLLPAVAVVFAGGAGQSSHIIATKRTDRACAGHDKSQPTRDRCLFREEWRLTSLPLVHSTSDGWRDQPGPTLTFTFVGLSLLTWLGIGHATRTSDKSENRGATPTEPGSPAPGSMIGGS